MRFYLTHQRLPPELRPCQVRRRRDQVLLITHPCSPRIDVLTWVVLNLTRDEQNVLRAGYGQPPVGEPVEDWLLQGKVSFGVPESLRLPQERQRLPRALGA